MLYEELLISSKERFDKFFENVPIFENQFTWSDFNSRCYECMYTNNSYTQIATVKEMKEKIPGLKDTCKNAEHFLYHLEIRAYPNMMLF